jgi:hypothetical protein
MKAKLEIWSLAVLVIAFLLVGSVAQATDLRVLEEQGLECGDEALTNVPGNGGTTPTLDSIPEDGALLIPDSDADVVGMYDPNDGTFLGNLISGFGLFSRPLNAIKGPDGNIYVSDQVADAIFVFDANGQYLSTYADESDGLDNIRGIDFRNDTLFVTTIHPYVAAFAGPHNRISDFITGSGAFDILFLEDGRSLLSSHGSTSSIQLYDVDGSYISQLFSVSFPEQVSIDYQAPGDFLSAAFATGDRIDDFDINGTIFQSWTWQYGRGVFRLGNGNLLTNSSHSSHRGVYEIDPSTGGIVEQENSGSEFRFIEIYKVESTGVDGGVETPRGFSLGQNYPNPFNARTSISFSISQNSEVTVEIYNLIGQRVATPFAGQLAAGNHSVTWDAADFASGVYYYKVSAGDYSNIKMMTLLK